jgi:hypothetical protein
MQEDNILLIYENKRDNIRISFECGSDMDIYELMQKFKELALAMGYHHKSVDEGFLMMSEEIEVRHEGQEQNSENDKID